MTTPKLYHVYIFTLRDEECEDMFEWGVYTDQARAVRVADMLNACWVWALIMSDSNAGGPGVARGAGK